MTYLTATELEKILNFPAKVGDYQQFARDGAFQLNLASMPPAPLLSEVDFWT